MASAPASSGSVPRSAQDPSSTNKPPSKLAPLVENTAANVTKSSTPNTAPKVATAQPGRPDAQQALAGDSSFKFDFFGSTPSMSNMSFGSFPSFPSLATMPHPGDKQDTSGPAGSAVAPPTDNGRLVTPPSAPANGAPRPIAQQGTQQVAPRGAPPQQARGGASRPSSQPLAPLQPHPSAPSSSAGAPAPQQSPSSPSSTAVVPASPGQSDRRVINPVTVPNGQNFVDITEYLNMPQSEAAKKLSIPPSTLSKRWKEAVRNRKWPWRVVCKLDKEIMTLLHNVPQGAPIPEEIEGRLGYLMRKRQEELKPVVIRL